MKRVWGATALAALAFAAPAYGQQLGWGASDAPSLSARVAPFDPTNEVQAFRCPGGGACEPVAITPSGAVDLTTLAAGDVYEARWIVDGQVAQTVRTPAWLGRYHFTRQPTVAGVPAVGGALSAVDGAGTGGWASPWRAEGSNLVFCRSPDATDCLDPGPDSRDVVPGKRWVGWYAFATTQILSYARHPSDAIPAVAATVYPHALPTLRLGPGIAVSAPVGPIETATATVRARALRRDHRLSIAHVRCPVRCSVALTVRGGGETVRRWIHVTGTRALTIAPRHGRLQVKVVVDGKTLASGVSRAR